MPSVESMASSMETEKEGIGSFLKKIMNKDVDSLRIPIPMFLLEPVSTLMYVADVGRVEDFVSICSLPPLDRILQVCRLFLSQIQLMNSRSSKKPLNPILGESLTATYQSSMHPTCTLVAEQVSHHPPICTIILT